MGRSQCCAMEGLKKGTWTAEEDRKLVAFVLKHGEREWNSLPQRAGLLRRGKSCRLRWANYLRPGIKRGDFSPEEEQTIIRLHAALGNRWATIARQLHRRTDNEIKNYWATRLKKRAAENGAGTTHVDHPEAEQNSTNTSDSTHSHCLKVARFVKPTKNNTAENNSVVSGKTTSTTATSSSGVSSANISEFGRALSESTASASALRLNRIASKIRFVDLRGVLVGEGKQSMELQPPPEEVLSSEGTATRNAEDFGDVIVIDDLQQVTEYYFADFFRPTQSMN